MTDIKGKELAEFAFDIQTGLGPMGVPEFDDIRTIGMAASLALHLRGLPEIQYGVLSQVSDARFDIPAQVLKNVLRLLSEVGMVRLYERGRHIDKIDPQVPYFEDVYEKIGELSAEYRYNEVERATVHILSELSKRPENRDRLLHRTGMERRLFDRCIDIGTAGSLISAHRVRERSMLISPLYYADNSQALADLVAKVGSDDFEAVVDAIAQNQGWPLSMIIKKQAIAGRPLTPVQVELARLLSQENMLKPPTLEIGTFSESFVFTPRPGNARLSPGKRDIYEKSMALVAAVRKGQLLPFRYPIRSPAIVLRSLLEKGYLKETTETLRQYGKVAGSYNVGYFEERAAGWHRFRLRNTEENIEAVQMAIALAEGENVAVEMRTDEQARALLQKDEKYVSSVLGAKQIKERRRFDPSAEATEQWEQLTLSI